MRPRVAPAKLDAMGVGAGHPRSPVEHRARIAILPSTVLGRVAVVLAAAFLPLVFAAAVVPRGAAIGLFCGLAGGVAALVAIVRDRERSVMAFAALAPLAVAVAFLLAEAIGGGH
jgi:hypothetical protein